MSARTLFVTGTDTGAGKTVVASTVLRQLAADGRRAVGFKPVASGCEMTPDGLRNDDAQAFTGGRFGVLRLRTTQSLRLRTGHRAASGGRGGRYARRHRYARPRPCVAGATGRLGDCRGRWRLGGAAERRHQFWRLGGAAQLAGVAGGGHATGLHQPRDAQRRGDQPSRRLVGWVASGLASAWTRTTPIWRA
nr:AAA family ATPase [Polycyclovorans algicola]